MANDKMLSFITVNGVPNLSTLNFQLRHNPENATVVSLYHTQNIELL